MNKQDIITGIKLGFQNACSPIGEGIHNLHDKIFFWLIIIIVLVLLIMLCIYKESVWDKENPTEERLENIKKNYIEKNKIAHGTLLEIVWTIIPSMILVMIAIPSFSLLYSIDEIIDPEETVKVLGSQWYWNYEQLLRNWSLEVKNMTKNIIQSINEYSIEKGLKIIGNKNSFSVFKGFDNSYSSYDSYMAPITDLSIGDLRLLEVDNPLVLSVKTHLRFIITSSDVLHSFSVPSLGIKMDAVPGRLNQISSFINREGVYYGQCSELCGVNHGFMPIKIVSLEDFLLIGVKK